MSGILGIREAAKLMKLYPQIVYGLIGPGTLRAGKLGRAYVMLENDVMKYIERTIEAQTIERFQTIKGK